MYFKDSLYDRYLLGFSFLISISYFLFLIPGFTTTPATSTCTRGKEHVRGLGSGNEKGAGGTPPLSPRMRVPITVWFTRLREKRKRMYAHGGGGQDTTCQPVFIRTWLQIDFGCSAGREVSLLTYGCLIYKRRLIAAENTFLKKRKSLENCNQY